MKTVFAAWSTKHSIWATAFILSAVLFSAGAQDTDYTVQAELHCVVMPSDMVDVSSGVSGRIETLNVERGDAVTAGQILAVLESGAERAELVQARLRANLDTEISLRKTRLGFEIRKSERTDNMLTQQFLSEIEQDKVQTDATLAGWQLRQAVDDQFLARLEIDRAADLLNRRTASSPINGVVVDRYKSPGEYVDVGEEPILRVAQLDPLWVEVVVPVSLYQSIKKDMLADVFSEVGADQVREARVSVIDPMADASSGTFRVRLELPNPDLTMLSGTKCTARFPDLSSPVGPVSDKGSATRVQQPVVPAVSTEPHEKLG